MVKEIQLTRGKVALVDEEDYEMLVAVRWCVSDGYAYSAKLGRMHRFIISAQKGVMVDHINGNKLDNRRSNLRLCTNSQNQANRKHVCGKSKFKGVVWQSRSNGTGFWKATIIVNGKAIYLGRFETDLEAAKAYNRAASEHFGEFAHLNDITLEPSTLISSDRVIKAQIGRSNSSGFKGVSHDKVRNKWVAQLRYQGEWYLRKRFDSAEEAARAYDEVARSVFGVTAKTNF